MLKDKFKKIKLINYDFSINMLREARKKQNDQTNSCLEIDDLSFVCGDIEELSFPESTFDIIWSTSSFQWCNNISDTFKEIKKILKPGGFFLFSTFGPNTLFELKNITKEISKYQKTNDFVSFQSIKNILDTEGFSKPKIKSEEFCIAYKDVTKLFLDLKKIGASSGFESKKIGLSGKLFLKLISDGYKKYSYDGIFPATYEVFYGYAWKDSDK